MPLCAAGLTFIKSVLGNFQGNYLEIGVFNGELISELGQQFTDRKIIGIDPFIEDGNTVTITNAIKGGKINTQRQNTLNAISDKPNVTLFEMTSKDFLGQLTQEQIDEFNINIVLIDGSHWYDDVVIDFEISRRLINTKPGIIVVDDIGPGMPEVERAKEEFKAQHSNLVTKVTLPQGGIVEAIFLNGGEKYA